MELEDQRPVAALIDAAFAEAQQPHTVEELATPSLDLPYVLRHFLGRSQEDIERLFAGHEYMEDFDSMTPSAVEYYLPAVMRYMLRVPDDIQSWAWVHGSFGRRNDGDIWPNFRSLTIAQYEAIATWADYLMRYWDKHPELGIDPVDAMEIVETYRTRAEQLMDVNRS